MSDHQALRAYALSLPEAVEDMPWGHPAIKVRARTFVFMGNADEPLSLSMKLPASRDFALDAFDFTAPTGYGLGRSGWITCTFGDGDSPDVELLQRWIAESYRTIAPKKLAALLPDEA